MKPIVDKGESRKLFEWVKADKEPMPLSDVEEKTFHTIIENDEGVKTDMVVWHLSDEYYKNTLTGSYYRIPADKIEWLKPIPQSSLKEETWDDIKKKYLESEAYASDPNSVYWQIFLTWLRNNYPSPSLTPKSIRDSDQIEKAMRDMADWCRNNCVDSVSVANYISSYTASLKPNK